MTSPPTFPPAAAFVLLVVVASCDCSGRRDEVEPARSERVEPQPGDVTPSDARKSVERDAPEAPDDPPATSVAAKEPSAVDPIDLRGLGTKDAAKALRQAAASKQSAAALGGLEPGGSVILEVSYANCDASAEECAPRRQDLDPKRFRSWVQDNIIDPPGWDAGPLEKCEDGCCTFEDLAHQAEADELNVPHELYELRQICFKTDAKGTVAGFGIVVFVQH